MFIDMMIRGFNSGVGGDGILFLSNCLFATCTLKQNAFHGFALIGSVSVIYCESYYVLLFVWRWLKGKCSFRCLMNYHLVLYLNQNIDMYSDK